MPSSGQTLTCFVKAVFGITSLRFICMSDILAMVWYMWFKNHIENIDLKSHHQALGSIQELRQSVFHNFGPSIPTVMPTLSAQTKTPHTPLIC